MQTAGIGVEATCMQSVVILVLVVRIANAESLHSAVHSVCNDFLFKNLFYTDSFLSYDGQFAKLFSIKSIFFYSPEMENT